MKQVLVIAERRGAVLDEGVFELLTAARALAGGGGRVAAAVLGHGIGGLAAELARGFDRVFAFDDERLAEPDGDGDAQALLPLLARGGFDAVLLAHGNLGIDLAPGLSVRAGMPLLADCLELHWAGQSLAGTRAVYGGKVHARVVAAAGGTGAMATVRGGAFAPAGPGTVAGEVVAAALPAEFAPRRRPLRTLRPEAGEVDITQSERLVAVGRGIEDEDGLQLVRGLAAALGADLCASRPVVDKGWLPRSCQVGTSGVTVRPKLYVAVGISGSFQHMGGIKGSPFVVAINKDRAAPIFGVADVGIVGDLSEVVPALEAAIEEQKG
ncbi:MAG: electron transfer flavoprotein subunit alpha/FixB family protein [Planctomycetes bacterium]|nr:electron transfer flavoprotein subunit alpha/FixB family protein [Planctomycetota bacterium]